MPPSPWVGEDDHKAGEYQETAIRMAESDQPSQIPAQCWRARSSLVCSEERDGCLGQRHEMLTGSADHGIAAHNVVYAIWAYIRHSVEASEPG
jgi:hypothetical protein